MNSITIKLTTDRGTAWWTAQIVEVPAAISQGKTPHEACANVLDALDDLRA